MEIEWALYWVSIALFILSGFMLDNSFGIASIYLAIGAVFVLVTSVFIRVDKFIDRSESRGN